MGIRKTSATVDLDVRALVLATREYLGLAKHIKDLSARQGEIKKKLSDAVEKSGEPDDRGHIWLRLPEEVEGVVALQKQRRVSQVLDEDKATEILTKANLLDECSQMVRVIDQEAVMASHYNGLLSEEQVDAMYPKKVTYAFLTAKD